MVICLSLWFLSGSAAVLLPDSTSEMKPIRVTFYFANNSSVLMGDHHINQVAQGHLDRILDAIEIISQLDSIVVEGGASIPGSWQTNDRLAYERAQAVRNYIRARYPQIAPRKIHVTWAAVNWEALRQQVEQDPFVPYREDVMQIITLPLSDESKLTQIELLGNGVPKSYIIKNFSSYMRSATGLAFHMPKELQDRFASFVTKAEVQSAPVIAQTPVLPVIVETPAISEIADIPAPLAARVEPPAPRVVLPTVVTTRYARQSGVYEQKSLFALKTNLLFDVGSILNAEVEIPIGQRWSVAVEGIFPWWLFESKQQALEIMSGNLDVKLWLGNRQNRPQMTGWFAGLHGGAGYYDIEWNRKGYQGEFIVGGLLGGYAHTINRNGILRMEYALGVGYLETKYREYEARIGSDGQWHLIRQNDGKFTWIGPTRAKVSLVWMLRHRSQKK